MFSVLCSHISSCDLECLGLLYSVCAVEKYTGHLLTFLHNCNAFLFQARSKGSKDNSPLEQLAPQQYVGTGRPIVTQQHPTSQSSQVLYLSLPFGRNSYHRNSLQFIDHNAKFYLIFI